VTAVSGATITVSYRSVNGAGLAWLAANGNATTVTVDTTGALIERRGGSAIAVGDRVELSANPPTSGTTVLAVKVEASPGAQVHPSPSAELGLVGTIAAVTATTIDVTIRVANDGATTWLAANGNPSVVTVDVSNARVEREGGSGLTVGDRVVVHATAPQSGTVLLGREVEAAPASGQSSTPQSAPLVFQGQVATVGTSSATVTLREANRAARTWLAANGNLTTVALDLTTASIQRSGGGSLQVGDLVQFSATAPVSGTTLVAVRVEASNRSGSSDGENQQSAPLSFTGTIATVGQNSITVTLAQVNDAAKTYLAANGNPTSVTVDITQARILRDHGGILSVGDTVAIRATTPASGTVFTATRVEAEPQHQDHGNH
jgi:ribosomal protein S17